MDKNKKDKIIITVVCIVLSVVLWIYVTNVENKTRSTDINKIPVEMINQDSLKNSKLVLAPNQEIYVNLRVEGNTSDINKIKKSDFKIQVNLEEYVWKKGDNKVPVSVVDYPISISIKNTNTLTALIKVEELKEKAMTVESQIQVQTLEGYFVGETKILENKIQVEGPESLIEKADKIVVKDTLSNISQDINRDYDLLVIDKDGDIIEGLKLSKERVNVDIKINKGKSVKLISNTVGQLRDGLSLKSIDIERETVEIIGSSDVLENITEIKTKEIDLSLITESTELFLEVVPVDGISIKAGEEYVKVTINIEKQIEKAFTIIYSTTGLKDMIKFTPDKEQVKIVISGYESEINKIQENNLKVSLNLDGFIENGSFEKSPEVVLDGVISEFKVDSIESVKFTIEKIVTDQVDIPTNSGND